MPKWIRVRDTQTGHTFDVEASALPHRRGVEPVDDPERWPDVEGARAVPRPAKPYVGKDGRPRSANSGAQTLADTAEQTTDVPSDNATAVPATQASGRRGARTTSTPADAPADTHSSKETER